MTGSTNVSRLPESFERDGLGSRSFVGLLVTQFLGALNDNAFRWFAVAMATPASVLGGDEALSLGLVCFTLPYLVLAALAGYVADRYSKRSVIVACKVAEIFLMILGIWAVAIGNITFLFAVVGLMGCQSALFGPSKFGSIPEMLTDEKISSGNGWMGMVTVIASAIGLAIGYGINDICEPDLTTTTPLAALWPAVAILVGTAILGTVSSLFIGRLPVADPSRRVSINPFPETYESLRLLARSKPLLRTSLGIAFFWFLASLAQSNITLFAQQELQLREQIQVVPLMLILVIGMALGSLLAGKWSGGTVELGIVPLGALGIAGSAVGLYLAGVLVDPKDLSTVHAAYYWVCGWLLTLGLSAGLFNIPLESFLQYRSHVKTRGTILAASNFISFSFMLGSAGVLYGMNRLLGNSASETIFLVVGLGTLPVFIYVVWLLPTATIRFAVWLASHTAYRVRVYGRENIPERGGALLVANHVSWIDGILILISSVRPIRMIAYADYIQGWGVRQLARIFGVIPIKGSEGPKSLLRSMKTAKEAVEQGELVCIFAEGEITRTGQLLSFQRGLTRIVEGTHAPVIPVYLDGLWGSIFSYRGGRVLWKWPKKWPHPVTIVFGEPLLHAEDANHVRQAVQDLGAEAVEHRISKESVLPRRFVRKCKRNLFRPKIAESSGQEFTSGKLLAATIIFKWQLERHVVTNDERMVGVLLPPSIGGVVANTALSIMQKVPVNLNYTLSDEDLNYCIKECGIKHVLTSRKVLEKRAFELDAEYVFLEDLKEKATRLDTVRAVFRSLFVPTFILERLLGLTKISPDDLATVVFTSGSTGEPKGVMLSHRNISSNIDAAEELFHIEKTDMVLGVLPFFHSFGFTLTLWLPLTTDTKVIYHFNPADGRQVGKLCAKYGVTITMATPTFLKNYLKRCEPEQMRKLDLAVVGAERCPVELANAFQQKFGVSPTEGFGATELSPLATANVPDHRSTGVHQVGTKLGSVGRAVPGVSAKIVNPETWEPLATDVEGLLVIKGPNVMQGYLNRPEKTAEVIRNGWYNTGDIAKIDKDGFVWITGRQSRFSKIGGEMVPHLKIEEALARIVDDPDVDDEGILIAVTSVPDEKKGERIVVIHKPLKKTVREVLKELADTGLPNLWLPSADSFCEVDEIPLLGTGKLDLKGLNQLALERFTPAAAEK